MAHRYPHPEREYRLIDFPKGKSYLDADVLRIENERLREENEELKRRIEELEEEVKRRDPFYDAERRLAEMRRMKLEMCSFRLPSAMIEEIDRIADEKGYTRTEVVRLVLDTLVSVHRKGMIGKKGLAGSTTLEMSRRTLEEARRMLDLIGKDHRTR
jgi:cell division septum initiation protein DivIVA